MSDTCPSSPVLLHADVNGTAVEVRCYGSGKDWVCRLIYAKEHRGPVNDAYYPPPVLGMFWVRQQDDRWLASGMVNRKTFQDAEAIHALLRRIIWVLFKTDEVPASCVELVEPKFVSIANGEEGNLFFEGGGLEARWGPLPETDPRG